jgi:hypothetical protein
LAADFDGNVYFSVQAQSRVYRLGRDGRVIAYAGNGVHGKQLDGAAPAASSPLLLAPPILSEMHLLSHRLEVSRHSVHTNRDAVDD